MLTTSLNSKAAIALDTDAIDQYWPKGGIERKEFRLKPVLQTVRRLATAAT